MDRIYRYAAAGTTRYARAKAVTGLVEVARPVAFPQRPGALDALLGSANGEPTQDEAAFTVRVQGPDKASNLPVMVFIPGGGFLSGTGMTRWFDQPSDEESPHILVTVNYRLGVLGHLGPEPKPEASQRPLEDLELALRWVQIHIENFGGDPENITLAGDSAGAWYSYALATLPQTKGLFRRLALISLPRQAPQTEDQYLARWEFAHESLTPAGGFVDAPVEQLLDTQQALAKHFAGQGMPLMPAAGGHISERLHDYEDSVQDLHVDDLLILSTEHEAQAFLLPVQEQAFDAAAIDGYAHAHFARPEQVVAWVQQQQPNSHKQQMAALITLYQFTQAARELAVAGEQAGLRVFIAGFGLTTPVTGGSPHCMTLPFIFGQRDGWWDAPMLEGIADDILTATSEAVRSWLRGFIAEGQPRLSEAYGVSEHPQFRSATPMRLDFGLDNAHKVTAELREPVEWAYETKAQYVNAE